MNGTAAGVVRAFYTAVRAGDGAAIVAVVRDHFAGDATVTWPASLPYGGTVAGRSKLERVLVGATAVKEPVGVRNLSLTGLIDGGDRIAAELGFDWYGPDGGEPLTGTGAVELWTFADGLVTEIRAYYWDTAACAAWGR